MPVKFATLSACILLLGACSQSSDSSADVAASEADAGAAGFDAANGQDTAVEVAEQAAYDGQIPMPIRIGTDGPGMDACGTLAQVSNLDPEGDGYLSVRDAPSTTTKERDRLASGQAVQVCATSDGWNGIVYSKDGEPKLQCGTGSPVATEKNYTGPCRQGWVYGRFLDMVAG